MAFKTFVEEVRVFAHDLPEKIRELAHEGNVRRIIIKDDKGHTFVEIPVTVAAVGALLAPILAAVGALAAMAARFTVVVERTREEETTPPEAGKAAAAEEPPKGESC